MSKKFLTFGLSSVIAALYVLIVLYVFFAVLPIESIANFDVGMFFEIIGFAILAWLIYGNILSKPIKTGYFVPLVIVTIIYTIVLDGLNFWMIMIMPNVFFVLAHLILLLLYCLVSIPMYIMGRK